MDFDVLPGPPLAELARTTMARAFAATVSWAGARDTVPMRADRTGRPVLLPHGGSALARDLADEPAIVTLAVPAPTPFSSLRITGLTRPGGWHGGYPVILKSLEFTGANPAPITPGEYGAAAPDPFWREAPAVVNHLERCHTAELVACVQAHGLTAAEYVLPRGLDRFGLELLVFTSSGLASVRLAYPDGPVSSLSEVPMSIRAVLTCRCD
jgi:hypothetical protein